MRIKFNYINKIYESFFKKAAPIIDIILNYLLVPKKENIFFKSFEGKYSDSPKYISEVINEIAPNIKLVWAIDGVKDKPWLPSYIKCVKPWTFRYFLEKHKSKVLIENGAGEYLIIKDNPVIFRKHLKNKRQLNISTWHGTPLKKIGKDIENVRNPFIFSTSDILIAGNYFEANKFKECFNMQKGIWLIGKPRNDIFFSLNSNKIKKIKQKLNIPEDKNILLYAPTFRERYNRKYCLNDIICQFDLIKEELKKKYGGEWIIILRFHHYEKNLNNIYFNKKDYYDGNKYDDMNEYLAITDILITDYSSSMFDFMLMKKPIFLLVPDWDNYKMERGTYFELNELPFPYAFSVSELCEKIRKYSEDDYKRKLEIFVKALGICENGTASLRVANLILKYLNNANLDIYKLLQ
jgi:CDP-glycerol glycerophosphotransferase